MSCVRDVPNRWAVAKEKSWTVRMTITFIQCFHLHRPSLVLQVYDPERFADVSLHKHRFSSIFTGLILLHGHSNQEYNHWSRIFRTAVDDRPHATDFAEHKREKWSISIYNLPPFPNGMIIEKLKHSLQGCVDDQVFFAACATKVTRFTVFIQISLKKH